MIGLAIGIPLGFVAYYMILKPLCGYFYKRYGISGYIWFMRMVMFCGFMASLYGDGMIFTVFMYMNLAGLAVNMIVYNPWRLRDLVEIEQIIQKEEAEAKSKP